jgi:hypothetical protein
VKYELTNPCGLCPFRNDDKRLYVDPQRLKEFSLGEFVCHQTAVCEEAGDETGNEGGFIDNGTTSQHCAGALIFNEHLEWPHQMARIAERLGMYDHTKLNMKAPVFRSWEEVEEAENR